MKKINSVLWGLIIIIVGVIFLGNNYDLWNIDIFFDGWWTLFIIIPSVFGLCQKQWVSSLLGIAIGVLLLLACQEIIVWNMVGKSFVPILLILIGLSVIFRPKAKVGINKKGLPEYVGVFSSNEQKLTGVFKGLSSVAVFGGVELDLRGTKIEEDIVIDCVSVFGGIDLLMPEGVSIKTSGVPIFGGAENKYPGKEGPIVYVNYVAIFGGIDIK